MSRTVLVADDSLIIQKVIRLALKDENIRVVTVASGAEAIKRIDQAPPAMVLADTRMPDGDGYEVGEFVKAEPKRSQIPVVLMTGAFEPVDDTRARTVSDAILVKPFDPDRLVATVRKLLGGVPAVRDVAPASRDSCTQTGEPAEDVSRALAAETADVTLQVVDEATVPRVPTMVTSSKPARQPSEPEGLLPSAITDELIDRLAARVITRLSDRVVRETMRQVVTQVAERLVSEEIERLKEKLR